MLTFLRFLLLLEGGRLNQRPTAELGHGGQNLATLTSNRSTEGLASNFAFLTHPIGCAHSYLLIVVFMARFGRGVVLRKGRSKSKVMAAETSQFQPRSRCTEGSAQNDALRQ